jgi:hypothetical protein
MQQFAEIKAPQWANTEQTMLDLQVRLEGSDTFIPYCAMMCEEAVPKALFEQAVAGGFGAIAPVSSARYADKARGQRDSLLKNSDWTQLPDVPQATKDAWAGYRQALRDVPAQSGFPFNIVWPMAPA